MMPLHINYSNIVKRNSNKKEEDLPPYSMNACMLTAPSASSIKHNGSNSNEPVFVEGLHQSYENGACLQNKILLHNNIIYS